MFTYQEPVAPEDVCKRNGTTGKVALGATLCAALVLLIPAIKNVASAGGAAGKFAPGFIAMGIVFPLMILCESMVFKPHRDWFDFSLKRTLDGAAKRRITKKFVVHLLCLILLGVFYAAIAIFIKSTYLLLFLLLSPVLLFLPFIYFWLTEKYGKDGADVDEFLAASNSLSAWLASRGKPRAERAPSPFKNHHTCNLVRTYFVKGFFIPYMTFSSCAAWLFWSEKGSVLFSTHWFANQSTMALAADFAALYAILIPLIVAAEVTIGTVGYIASTRLLGTHIVRTEPTILGWLVCVVCYSPFDKLFDIGKLLPVETEWPLTFAQTHPLLSIICCIATLLLWTGYTWATFTFGLRFSNLTNRGTIDFGPYAVVRHPAYALKTICWWVTLTPVALMQPQNLIYGAPALAVITTFYVLRAITEERNMSVDPRYLEYKKRVRCMFIPWII